MLSISIAVCCLYIWAVVLKYAPSLLLNFYGLTIGLRAYFMCSLYSYESSACGDAGSIVVCSLAYRSLVANAITDCTQGIRKVCLCLGTRSRCATNVASFPDWRTKRRRLYFTPFQGRNVGLPITLVARPHTSITDCLYCKLQIFNL